MRRLRGVRRGADDRRDAWGRIGLSSSRTERSMRGGRVSFTPFAPRRERNVYGQRYSIGQERRERVWFASPHHFVTSSPDLVGLRPDVSVSWNPSLDLRRVNFDLPGDSFSTPEGLLGLPRASPEASNRPQTGSPGRPGDPLKTGRPMVVRLHKPTGTILVACASKSDPPRPGFVH